MERAQTTLEEELESAVYTDRLLLLIESEDGFRQVLLTKEQFKRISDAAVHRHRGKNGNGDDVDFMVNLAHVIPKEWFEFMTDYE